MADRWKPKAALDSAKQRVGAARLLDPDAVAVGCDCDQDRAATVNAFDATATRVVVALVKSDEDHAPTTECS